MASFQGDRSVTLFNRSPILGGLIARRLQKLGPPPWLLVLFTMCSANAIAAILLGKEMNWDLLNYHFYNGYALLHGRFDLDLAPAQAQTFLNPLIDVPLYLAIVSLPPIAVGAVYGFAQGLNGVAVWLIGQELLPIEDDRRRRWVAFGLAILGALGSINLSEVGGSMADTVVSIPVLFSTALLLAKRRHLETAPLSVIGWAGLAGAISGIGVGLKITAALFVIGFALGCLVLVRAWSRRMLVAVAFAAGAVVTWLLLNGFWLARMWSRFGDPLFPFVRLFNSRPEFVGIVAPPDTRFVPRSAIRALLYPFAWVIDSTTVSEASFRDWHLTVLYLLLALLVLRWCVVRVRQAWRFPEIPAGASAFLLVGGVTSYAVWLSKFGVYRYLAPLEWLAPLAITMALMALIRPPHRTTAILVVLLLTTLTVKPANWGRAGWAGSYFAVDVPRLAAGPSPMVLIAGLNGLSYLVPQFPADVRFIRLQSNMFLYGMALGGYYGEGHPHNQLDDLVRNAVASHQGDVYVLADGLSKQPAAELAGAYRLDAVLWKLRLRLRPESCQPVRLFKLSSPPWAFLRPAYDQHALRPETAVCEASRVEQLLSASVFQGTKRRIARLYFAYFGRVPDDSGLEPWVERSRAGMNLASISGAFAKTPEFQSRYGSLNNERFVTLVYRNLLGRDPDPEGLAHWVGQLGSGALSRPQMVLIFSDSPEFREIFSLARKGG